ncbi:hypothetical protein GLAREA_00547 [Glarea lozoyensis ATCC 20868]|uniref:Uncharacterized protein n=1 Tax=Glarea lozoyensis (strain ATCC 20868 / MF5171) TaxID=1116229 RepID=S3CSI1_GLAL2|nr:uncharacterized protein GLAREA_00547 [Glarea lozoyensis ATCC 20868]EPE29387.1 hypothetical protein GLAREA_00547 [Glarea lozoyensis ATCC 20868]
MGLKSVALLSLACDVLAIAVPREAVPCTFSLTAVGMENGSIRQDTIGQPRIGGMYPKNTYIIENGSLKDSRGHTCIIAEGSSQLQCTAGLPNNTPFSLSDNNYVEHDRNSNWLACPADGPSNDGSSIIFSDAKQDKTGCYAVEILAGGFACAALGRPSSPGVSSTSSVDSPGSTTTIQGQITTHTTVTVTTAPYPTVETVVRAEASCPNDIRSGIFQYPHLIVPTSPQSPDHAFGNSYKAYISPTNTTLFNFDIPDQAPYLGTCGLVFQFPYRSQLAWHNEPTFYFSGLEQEVGSNGGLNFALLSGVADSSTTYNDIAPVDTNYGKTKIVPGNNYTIATFPCRAGTFTYEVSSVGGVEFNFYQDSRPYAVGLYIVPCS